MGAVGVAGVSYPPEDLPSSDPLPSLNRHAAPLKIRIVDILPGPQLENYVISSSVSQFQSGRGRRFGQGRVIDDAVVSFMNHTVGHSKYICPESYPIGIRRLPYVTADSMAPAIETKEIDGKSLRYCSTSLLNEHASPMG
jgi:hypothetical protein